MRDINQTGRAKDSVIGDKMEIGNICHSYKKLTM